MLVFTISLGELTPLFVMKISNSLAEQMDEYHRHLPIIIASTIGGSKVEEDAAVSKGFEVS